MQKEEGYVDRRGLQTPSKKRQRGSKRQKTKSEGRKKSLVIQGPTSKSVQGERMKGAGLSGFLENREDSTFDSP